jgi:hypothetical protein
MKRYRTNFALIAIAVSIVSESACAETWTNYRIPETGGSVDIPSSIFTEDIGKPEGYGQRLRSSDGRADLTVQYTPIERGVSRLPSSPERIRHPTLSTSALRHASS